MSKALKLGLLNHNSPAVSWSARTSDPLFPIVLHGQHNRKRRLLSHLFHFLFLCRSHQLAPRATQHVLSLLLSMCSEPGRGGDCCQPSRGAGCDLSTTYPRLGTDTLLEINTGTHFSNICNHRTDISINGCFLCGLGQSGVITSTLKTGWPRLRDGKSPAQKHTVARSHLEFLTLPQCSLARSICACSL